MLTNQQELLIDNIYDGIIENPPWKTLLHQLRSTLDCQISGIWFRSPFLAQAKLSISDNDPEFSALLPLFWDKYQQQAQLFQSEISPEELTIFSQSIPTDSLNDSPFYRDYLKPHNIIDGLQLFATEPGGLEFWLALGRAKGNSLFNQQDREFCQRLLPHLRRALTIYSTLKSVQQSAKISAEVVEQLSIGIITLDKEAKVINANNIAQQLLQQAQGVEIKQQKLKLSSKKEQITLDRYFDELSSLNHRNSSPNVELLRLIQSSGRDFGLLIRYAKGTPWYEGRGCPAVVVYICDPAAQRNTKQSFVAKLFDLTMSEAALAINLAEGLTLTEAAIKLTVTENTARTVSKRIFAKTGVRRQAELVRLILTSVAILG